MEKTRTLMVYASRETLGLVRLERVRVTCPACHKQVLAVARDGRVRGYCAAAKQYVDFTVETRESDAEHRARLSQAMKDDLPPIVIPLVKSLPHLG